MKVMIEVEADVAVLFLNLLAKADPLGMFTKPISQYIIEQLNKAKQDNEEPK